MEISESSWAETVNGIAEGAPAEPAAEPAVEAAAAPAETADAPESPEAPVETTDEVADEPEAAEAAPAENAETAEDLPEGVTVRDRNGKKEWVYPEERGKAIYEGFKLSREAGEIFGEDVTADVLRERQAAHDWLQTQRLDLTSSNPNDQVTAFANMFDDIGRSIEAGEISHDPRATVGRAFAMTLAHKAPEAYAEMSRGIMQDQINSLYQEAHKAGNTQLLRSVQNLDFKLNGKFLKDDQVAASVPTEVDERTRDLEAREARIAQADRQQAEKQWGTWKQAAVTGSRDAVTKAVSDGIPQNIKDAFKGTPEAIQRIEKLFRVEVEEAIKGDQNFLRTRDNLIRRAQNGSEAVRAEVASELAKRYTARAKQVISTKAAGIIGAETRAIKSANTATQQRHEAGKTRKAIPGTSTPVTRHLPSSGANGVGQAAWESFLSGG